jgi:predicted protein tyrosine phosphatase
MGSRPTLNIEKVGKLTFVRIQSGALAIGHRPPLRWLSHMRKAGVTHIVTVLSQQEHPQAIAEAAREAGLAWIWIELGSTKNLPAKAKPEIVEALRSLASVLENNGRVYLHCSAGIHRTGMIAAALLFLLGYNSAQVAETLASLRTVTAEGVGAARLDWARSFARPQPESDA